MNQMLYWLVGLDSDVMEILVVLFVIWEDFVGVGVVGVDYVVVVVVMQVVVGEGFESF